MPLFIAIFLSLYFISIGRFLVRRFERETTFIEGLALSFPLGAGFTGTAVFLLGCIGQIRFGSFLLFILMTWFFSLRETSSFLKELKRWMKRVPGRFSPFGIMLLCVLLAHCLLNVLYGLGPPVGFDATFYHLVMAKRYVEARFLIAQPDLWWTFGPQLQEMLMTLGLTLHSDLLASLLILIFSFWLLVALYQLGRRFLGREGALLAAALFWCMPLVVHYAPLMKNDLGASVFLVLACDRGFLLTQTYSAKRFLLLSILLGLALACKFTAAPSVLVIALLALWSLRKQKSTPHLAGVLAFALLFFAAVCLPYFIRSYLLTGNPLYPNAYRIFGGRFWESGVDEAFLKRHLGTKSLFQFLTYPIQFSLGEIYGGHVGTPLFLAFLPLLFLWRPLGEPLKRCLRTSLLIYGVSYLFFDIHTRYYFPVLCLLTFPTAYAIQKTWEEKGVVGRVGLFCVGLFLMFNLFITYAFTHDRFPVVLGRESRSSHLSRRLPYYPVIAYVNEYTKPTDRVLMVDLPGYYLERPFHHSSVYSGEILYHTLQTPEKLSERLQELGITHVIRIEKPMALLNWELLDGLKQRGVLVRAYEKNGYALYRFNPRRGIH